MKHKKSTKIVEEVRAPEGEDLVEGREEIVDIVERIYGTGHQRSCQYRPEINARGLIYCRTCDSQIGSILPEHIVKLPLSQYETARDRWLGHYQSL